MYACENYAVCICFGLFSPQYKVPFAHTSNINLILKLRAFNEKVGPKPLSQCALHVHWAETRSRSTQRDFDAYLHKETRSRPNIYTYIYLYKSPVCMEFWNYTDLDTLR